MPEPPSPPRTAFVYAGEGSEQVGMGLNLYETEPVVRALLDRCDAVFGAERGGASLIDVMFGRPGATGRLDDPEWAQPAIYSLACARAALWASVGVRPGVVAGHGIGELAAAWAAGVFTLEDGLRIAAAPDPRARPRMRMAPRAGRRPRALGTGIPGRTARRAPERSPPAPRSRWSASNRYRAARRSPRRRILAPAGERGGQHPATPAGYRGAGRRNRRGGRPTAGAGPHPAACMVGYGRPARPHLRGVGGERLRGGTADFVRRTVRGGGAPPDLPSGLPVPAQKTLVRAG